VYKKPIAAATGGTEQKYSFKMNSLNKHKNIQKNRKKKKTNKK